MPLFPFRSPDKISTIDTASSTTIGRDQDFAVVYTIFDERIENSQMRSGKPGSVKRTEQVVRFHQYHLLTKGEVMLIGKGDSFIRLFTCEFSEIDCNGSLHGNIPLWAQCPNE